MGSNVVCNWCLGVLEREPVIDGRRYHRTCWNAYMRKWRAERGVTEREREFRRRRQAKARGVDGSSDEGGAREVYLVSGAGVDGVVQGLSGGDRAES